MSVSISLYKKLKYYFEFLHHEFKTQFFPYEKILLTDTKVEKTNELNFVYYGYDNDITFPLQKVLIKYNGTKIFNIGMNVSSYNEINEKILDILEKNDFNQIIENKLPNFIEHIYLVDLLYNKIDILHIVENFIKNDDIDITFNDIIHLEQFDKTILKNVNVNYVEDFEQKEMTLSLNDSINSINNFL